MRVRLLSALAAALTVGTGLAVLAGLLIGPETLSELGTTLGVAGDDPGQTADDLNAIASFLLQLTTITVALTVLIGVLNLLSVHVRRVVRRQRGLIYSLVLVASFALAVGTYILDRDSSLVLLETVQLSVESALAGILFFALVYGAYRMMRHEVTWTGLLFVVVLLIVLVAALPIGGLDVIQDARDWLMEIPVSAGARGLLLGIALATVVTGVRLLIGVDRSYRE